MAQEEEEEEEEEGWRRGGRVWKVFLFLPSFPPFSGQIENISTEMDMSHQTVYQPWLYTANGTCRSRTKLR